MEIEESTKNKNTIKIYSVYISVIYNVYGTLLELEESTNEMNCFKLSLLDVETDKKESKTSIEFTDVKELETILQDFKKKFNNSQK